MIKQVSKLLLTVAGVIMITSCSSFNFFLFESDYPELKDEGSIAIVSYSLNKSIAGDKGPGLFNDKDKWYMYHQESVDAGWELFKSNVNIVFPDLNFIDPNLVEKNAEYQKLTSIEPKVSFGKDSSFAGTYVYPGKINHVDPKKKKLLEPIASSVNADYLMYIENSAGYREADLYNMESLVEGDKIEMALFTTITITNQYGKIIWTHKFSSYSKENAMINNGVVNFEEYPRLYQSATEDLLNQIKEASKK